MGVEGDIKRTEFLKKFDKALQLLNSFSEKSKSNFSENVSFLLDKALDHLKKLETEDERESRDGDLTHTTLIKSQSVKEFFSRTLNVTRAPIIHPPITIFAIKLFTQLTKSEARFRLMMSEANAVFSKIQQLTETTIVENSEIKQTLLSLFLSLASFRGGQDWLWASRMLLFITDCLSDRTIFTRKTARELINSVLPLMDDDPRNVIMAKLLEPVLQAGTKLDHRQIESDRLKPFFEVLENYLERCLSSGNLSGKLVGSQLLSGDVERALINLVQCAEHEKLLMQAGSLLAAIYAKSASELGSEHQSSLEEKNLKVIQMILRRAFLRPTLNVVSNSLFFWSRLEGSTRKFQMQLVCVMMVPVMMDNEEVADHFTCFPTLTQYWKDTAEGLTRAIVSSLTTLLQSNTELNELTGLVLAGLSKSISKLGKEFALKVTRSCLYLLGCLKTQETKRTAKLSCTPQLAVNLVKSLCSFIDVYEIRWWETYETICLPMLFTKLVANSASRDTQITCAGLNGLKFCIQQFIHPDQALLLDGSPHSTMNDAAEVLQRCSVSVHWEVRDSAMEVVLEMARLSHTKYPEFQNLLISARLLEAAVSAFNDTEAYVRASAINVIAMASPVPRLWAHLTQQVEVIEKCYEVLQQDNEALARRAAAKALSLIMQSGHFPIDQNRSVLYRNMSSAALSDLDWEVKLQTLDFWQVVVDESLREQGMIDGAFPECTFSKEKRKIVRLDAAEIRSRLQNSMAQLGESGCLHILLQLADDCDAPVRERSIQLLRKLRDLLAAYQSLDLNIWPACQKHHVAAPLPKMNDKVLDEGPIRVPSHDSDKVIDEILAVNDAKLVAGMMNNSQEPQLRPGAGITPSPLSARDFVTHINLMELESMLESTGLSSDLHVIDFDLLLDDLQDSIHTDSSRPRPDCY